MSNPNTTKELRFGFGKSVKKYATNKVTDNKFSHIQPYYMFGYTRQKFYKLREQSLSA